MWGKESQDRQMHQIQKKLLAKVCAEECDNEKGLKLMDAPENAVLHVVVTQSTV